MSMSLLALSLVFSFADLCLGQILETKAGLSRRYGPAIERSPLNPPWHPSDIVDDMCWFRHNDLEITVNFKRGKAVAFEYIKRARSTKRGVGPMTDDEIASILRLAVKNPDWILISGDDPTRRWRTRDSSVFAYYFRYRGHAYSRWWGPDNGLCVQTAAVDAAYQAQQDRRRALLRKETCPNAGANR
jgi:hypothetical protein